METAKAQIPPLYAWLNATSEATIVIQLQIKTPTGIDLTGIFLLEWKHCFSTVNPKEN